VLFDATAYGVIRLFFPSASAEPLGKERKGRKRGGRGDPWRGSPRKSLVTNQGCCQPDLSSPHRQLPIKKKRGRGKGEKAAEFSRSLDGRVDTTTSLLPGEPRPCETTGKRKKKGRREKKKKRKEHKGGGGFGVGCGFFVFFFFLGGGGGGRVWGFGRFASDFSLLLLP